MTKVHFVSKTVISANTFDLADHIQAMPNIEMQDHLLRGLVNDTDFLIKSAVYAAYKFVRAEVLDVSNATFVEIANIQTPVDSRPVSAPNRQGDQDR